MTIRISRLSSLSNSIPVRVVLSIVFRVRRLEELAAILQANDIKASPYHAGLDSETRSKTQDDFLMERVGYYCGNHSFWYGY